MRTIKFRVWDDSPIKDGYVGLMINHEYAIQSSYLIDALNGKHNLMQFTGLQDKTGVDIYEGDILKSKVELEGGTESIRKVVYGEGGFDMEKIEKDGKVDSMYLKKYWKHSLQVIGNIYENPELLSTPTAVL